MRFFSHVPTHLAIWLISSTNLLTWIEPPLSLPPCFLSRTSKLPNLGPFLIFRLCFVKIIIVGHLKPPGSSQKTRLNTTSASTKTRCGGVLTVMTCGVAQSNMAGWKKTTWNFGAFRGENHRSRRLKPFSSRSDMRKVDRRCLRDRDMWWRHYRTLTGHIYKKKLSGNITMEN